MKTTQSFFFQQADDMSSVKTESIELVVTSPPYPMIGMWDKSFEAQALNQEIKEALEEENGNLAFELMHKILNRVINS